MDQDIQNSTQTLTKKERQELRRQEKNNQQETTQITQNRKRIIKWLITIISLSAIVGVMIKIASIPGVEAPVKPLNETDWVRGNKTAPAVLIDYSDFQCPACGAYYPILKRLQRELGEEKLLIAYRQFPLTTIHKNAELAARASEAAGKQNKFWEMHDLLFDRQAKWENDSTAQNIFVSYAEELKLNKDQFIKDLDSAEVKNAVNEDVQSGEEAKVDGTPTFFLNGKRIPLTSSYEEFKALIEQSVNTSSTK